MLKKTSPRQVADFISQCAHAHRRSLSVLLAIVVLFGLLGYFWLPGFIKGKAEVLLAEKLHRPVSIERIEVSPYALALSVHGLRVGEKSGEGALLSFGMLEVNLSSASLLRMAPVVSSVTLVQPRLRVVRAADGSLSIDDLIADFRNQPESPPARFSVSNIQIGDGEIVFDDRQQGSRQVISAIGLALPFIASFESADDVWVEPRLVARINERAEVEINGRALPFADHREVVADIELRDLDLTGVDEYAPLPQGLKLAAGKLGTDLKLSFVQAPKTAPAIRLNGEIALSGLNVSNSAGLPWQLTGEKIGLTLKDADVLFKAPLGLSFAAENLRMKQGKHPEMRIGRLALEDVQVDPTQRTARFVLDAAINDKGTLKVSGTTGWAPLNAALDIDMQALDLVPLQGWWGDYLNATLTRGAAYFAGSVAASGAPMNVVVKGAARLADLNILDPAGTQDWLRWRSLDVSGINLATQPLNVDVEKIALADFFARVALSPEGRLNLKDLQKTKPDASGAAAETASASRGHASGQNEQKTAVPLKIGQILVQGGRVDFNDRFIKPNYRANLTGLSGKIGPLVAGTAGVIEIRGAVDRTAPLQILGKLDPFASELALDITAKAKGIDLPSFSPYSAKYVGYAIEKGKLSVDVHYQIAQGQLTAENNVFLDQLTFGEKVDSPDAMSVPVHLAVALLRNSRGEIDINLPISGSLNDPEFSIGGIVIKVFVNLIVKAVTSPFALLGSLFGGGADLSHADFVPGRSQLTPEAEKNIEALAKAMTERPGLKLEITGVVDAVNERDSLKRAMLDRRVKAQKLSALAKEGQSGGSVSEVEVSAAEYPKYLELAYKNEKFDKPKNMIGFTKSLPVPEMEQLMLQNLVVDEEAMKGLAERRTRNAREALLAKGIATERIFALQPRLETQADSKAVTARVEFSLR